MKRKKNTLKSKKRGFLFLWIAPFNEGNHKGYPYGFCLFCGHDKHWPEEFLSEMGDPMGRNEFPSKCSFFLSVDRAWIYEMTTKSRRKGEESIGLAISSNT